MPTLTLSQAEVDRALNEADAAGELATFYAITYFREHKVPLIYCLGGCGAALPAVAPFEPFCSTACEARYQPRRRAAA